MSLGRVDIRRAAEKLDHAAQNARPIPMLSIDEELSVEDGYRIQAALIERHLERRDLVTGIKLGLTSRAKMEQVGVHQPIRGILTQSMELSPDRPLETDLCCHPRIEPEIAFVLRKGLPSGELDFHTLWRHIERVHVALEVIDSRYKDFQFTLCDVVADNCSSRAYLLGDGRPVVTDPTFGPEDLANLGVILRHNGEMISTASTAAVLGHPLFSLLELTRGIGAEPTPTISGHVVLTGGLTAAVHVRAGDVVELEVESLGTCRIVCS